MSTLGRIGTVCAVIATAVGGIVAPAGPARAAPNDIVAIVIDGTGNGHGRGLSQWGAYGYAVDQGWNWTQILAHYYGGTTAGTVSSGERIRVRLTGYDGLGTVGVVSYGSPVISNGISQTSMYAQQTSTGAFDIWGSPNRECPGAGTSFSLIQAQVPSPSFTTVIGDSGAVPADQTLGVCNAAGAVTQYRGRIDVVRIASGNRVVNDVVAEQYLRGVVPKEVSALWAAAGGGTGKNAVMAQAVAARSYGLVEERNYFYDGSPYRYATTCDTTSCQVYGGSATRPGAVGAATVVEHPLSDIAISDTANVVRRWPAGHPQAGQLVRTEFSASNGPRTAGGAFPVVDDAGDSTARNPNHRWTRVIDAAALESKYGLGDLTEAVTAETTSSQYQGFDGIWYDDLVLTGTQATKRIQSWDLRGDFGLPSPGFTVRVIRQNTTGQSFGLVGDSVGASVTSPGVGEFGRLTGGTFGTVTIDSTVSRCTTREACPGTSGVEAAAALPSGLDLVVVELGYNDGAATFSSDINAMMTALTARGVGRVVWVNMADIRTGPSGSVYGPMNAALSNATTTWPTMTVLDWNAASAHPEARARWFADGVHLTATGRAEFALWLRGQIVGDSASHYLSPPRRIQLKVVDRAVTSAAGGALTVPANAAAVAINVTAVGPARAGFVTVWPCESQRRETSNLNYQGRDIVANNVIAAVDSNGEICLFSHVGTDLIVDVSGWFAAGGTGYQSVAPQRLVDSRIGLGAAAQRITPDRPIVVPIAGVVAQRVSGEAVTLPSDVRGVSLNITSTDAAADGFFTVWPCDVERKETSSLNYVRNGIVANGVISAVDASGSVCVHSSKPSNIVIDLQGWFDASSSVFSPTDPNRIVDSRKGLGAPTRQLRADEVLRIPVAGLNLVARGATVTVPADATAAVVNVVAVDPREAGFVTAWSCTGSVPTASNLNYETGGIVANGVIAPIGPDGSICLLSHADTDIVVDINGWMSDGFVGVIPDRFVDTRDGTGPAPT